MQSSEGELRAVQMRIGGLERRLKAQRWQFAGGLLLVLVIAWLLIPAAGATVTAETFVLEDAAGMRRAEMSMILDQPTVTLYDANGEIRGAFRIGADGRPEYVETPAEPM